MGRGTLIFDASRCVYSYLLHYLSEWDFNPQQGFTSCLPQSEPLLPRAPGPPAHQIPGVNQQPWKWLVISAQGGQSRQAICCCAIAWSAALNSLKLLSFNILCVLRKGCNLNLHLHFLSMKSVRLLTWWLMSELARCILEDQKIMYILVD